jgi:tRNA (cytidine/uridine-2'-O-)-methyltransferase
MLHIVLVEPEIPSNTGNISRTCAVTGAALHLVRPLGFSTDDKALKRAGLDYWHTLTLFYHDSIGELWAQYPDARFFYCSTHAAHRYDEVSFRDGDFLVFGKETAGLGEKILVPHADEAIRIPMGDGQRSLNLSNAVAIVVYEALRQNDFFGMR